MKHVPVVNPGSTSTKVGLFGVSDAWTTRETVDASPDAAGRHALLMPWPHSGGMTRPLEAGSCRIGERLKEDLLTDRYRTPCLQLRRPDCR